jgi:hypothetical protein
MAKFHIKKGTVFFGCLSVNRLHPCVRLRILVLARAVCRGAHRVVVIVETAEHHVERVAERCGLVFVDRVRVFVRA